MKRLAVSFLALILLVGALSVPAFAYEEVVPYASLYLSDYGAVAKAGSSSGELVIDFEVYSSVQATSIGVEKIKIYNASGTLVSTIYGSVSNGLKSSSRSAYINDYSYYGTSGASYYAEVFVFAKNASGSDSRTVTTETIRVR